MRCKSIRKGEVQGAFESLLREMTLTPQLLAIAKAMLRDIWDVRLSQASLGAARLDGQSAAIDARKAQFVERLVATDNPTLIATD